MIILTSLACMAITLYKEARGTTNYDEQLIALVIQNRARMTHSTACDVIFKPHQFSCFSKYYPRKNRFKNAAAMIRYYHAEDAIQLARAYYNASVSLATRWDAQHKQISNYHDNSIVPNWAQSMRLEYKDKDFSFYSVPKPLVWDLKEYM